MFESYYRFLGGPRTFWGHGGSFINNFYMGNPQHHCHGDNGMSKLMGWAYVFNMMQNMVRPQQQVIYPPYQPQVYSPQQSMYPYVNFSGREGAGGVAGNQQVNADLANLYNMYKDDGVKFGMIGDSIQARTKDGTVYKASTVEELADLLAEANPSDKKEEKTSLEERLQKTPKPEEDDDDKVDNNGKVGDDVTVNNDGNDGNNGKVKSKKESFYPPLKPGWEWKKYSDLPDATKNKMKIENGTSIDALIKAMGVNPENKDNKKFLTKVNPNAIKDGKVVDVNKLDIMVPENKSTKATKSQKTTSRKGASIATLEQRYVDNKQYSDGLIFNGNKNYMILKNEEGYNATNIDKDAIMIIGGKKYYVTHVRKDGLTDGIRRCNLDFCEMIGISKYVKPHNLMYKNGNSFSFGHAKANTGGGDEIEYKLEAMEEGKGALDGWDLVPSNGKVYLVKDGKKYDMNDIMQGKYPSICK